MRNRCLAAGIAAVALAVGWWALARRAAAAAPADSAGAAVRQGVELTVYSQDFGMVREARPVQLAAGDNRLALPEVSKEMDPQSVLLGWSGSAPTGGEIVAHAYDLGVQNPDALLRRYVGHDVEVVRYGQDGHESERQKGRVVVESGGNVVLQSEGRLFVDPPGSVVAPELKDVVTIPQLSVQAHSQAAGPAAVSLAYLTRGFSWSADYVATLAPKGDALNLECWATVTNRTGVDYPNAKVSLVAGSPNRAVEVASARAPAAVPAFADGQSKAVLFEAYGGRVARKRAIEPPESVGDFYQYRLSAPVTVVQERMNRLLMFPAAQVRIHPDYSATMPTLSAWDDYYGAWGSATRPQHGTVQAAFSFYNNEANGLGAPLPHGALRVYEPDSAGSLRYAGAAGIQDTPKDQKVDVTLSNAFDLTTESRIVSTKKVAKHTVRRQIEVMLHNEKAGSVKFRVVQPFGSQWNVVSESVKHLKTAAYTAQWTVEVPPGRNLPLTYSVDLAY